MSKTKAKAFEPCVTFNATKKQMEKMKPILDACLRNGGGGVLGEYDLRSDVMLFSFIPEPAVKFINRAIDCAKKEQAKTRKGK